MKRSFLVWALVSGHLGSSACHFRGQPNSPVGTWEVTVLGPRRGTSMMTFTNEFMVTGYGITRETIRALHTDTGTGGLIGTAMSSLPSPSAQQRQHRRQFYRQVRRSGGLVRKGPAPAATSVQGRGTRHIGLFPDLSGWCSRDRMVKRTGKILHETYAITASTNFPAVFDVTGAGLSDAGSYTLTGGMITTSRNKLGASITGDSPARETVRSSLYGKSSSPGKPAMSLQGHDDSGAAMTIEAIQ